MRKILMSDIKSGSENVKKVFKVTLSNRNATLLKQMTFTNDELLEIIELTELEDNQKYRQEIFFKTLVDSQPGPFSNEVIGKLTRYFQNYTDILKELLRKSPDQLAKNKITLFKLLVQKNGLTSPDIKEFDIDIKVYPYNVIFTARLIMNMNFNQPGFSQKPTVFSMLDTMTEEQTIETYKEAIVLDHNFEVFTQYSKTPTKIIDMLFKEYKKFGDKTLDKLVVLAELPNASDDIKGYVYAITGDDKHMPQSVKDIFIF